MITPAPSSWPMLWASAPHTERMNQVGHQKHEQCLEHVQHQRLLWPHEKQRVHHHDVGKAQLHARQKARDGERALNERKCHGQRKQQAGKGDAARFFVTASVLGHTAPSFTLRSAGSARSFPALPWQLPTRQTALPDGSAGRSARRSSGAAGRGRCTPPGS